MLSIRYRSVRYTAAAAVALAWPAASTSAQLLFEPFGPGTGDNWTILSVTNGESGVGDCDAFPNPEFCSPRNPSNLDDAFAFDYSSLGIPAAPGTTDASTLGLKVTLNDIPFQGGEQVSLNFFSKDETFSGNYKMSYDLWLEGFDPGEGSATESILAALNTDETAIDFETQSFPVINTIGSTGQPGVGWSLTADGGASNDVVAIVGDDQVGGKQAIGLFGDYSNFSRVGDIPNFENQFPEPGNFPGGFRGDGGTGEDVWHKIEVGQFELPTGNFLTFLTINGVLFDAFINTSDDTSGQVTFGGEDRFDSVDNNTTYIFDNILVEELTENPFPELDEILFRVDVNVDLKFDQADIDFVLDVEGLTPDDLVALDDDIIDVANGQTYFDFLDFNENGVLDGQADVDALLALIPDAPAVTGDADGDGDVDAFDLGIWQTQFGQTGDDLTADFDDDGDVDAFDLGLWQTNFGTGLEGAAVPEPATLGLLTLGVLASLRRRR